MAASFIHFVVNATIAVRNPEELHHNTSTLPRPRKREYTGATMGRTIERVCESGIGRDRERGGRAFGILNRR